MTEDEAKEKWCPMTQVSISRIEYTSNISLISNRESFGNDKCLGSKCMWWTNKLSGYCGAIKL